MELEIKCPELTMNIINAINHVMTFLNMPFDSKWSTAYHHNHSKYIIAYF